MDEAELADSTPLAFVAGVAQDLQIPDERAVAMAANWVAGHCRGRLVEVRDRLRARARRRCCCGAVCRAAHLALRATGSASLPDMHTHSLPLSFGLLYPHTFSLTYAHTCNAVPRHHCARCPPPKAYTDAKKGDDVGCATALFQLASLLSGLPMLEEGSSQVRGRRAALHELHVLHVLQ